MRKFKICICILLILALIPALLWAQGILPVKARNYIGKKYEGWNGVLRAWFCCEWACASGFNGWLNKCAAIFEKQNSGIYIEFEQVTKEAMLSMTHSGLNLPDLIVFSSGLLESHEGIIPLDCDVPLRGALSSVGDGYALPVAMGGYILAKTQEDTPAIAAPVDGRFNYSAALIALSETDVPEIEAPEAGIDLGLPASAARQTFALSRSDNALTDFINEETPAVVIDQKGLAQLIALRDAGRGPEWRLSESGRYAFTDQILMCAAVQSDRPDAAFREEFASKFAQSLLTQENQGNLSSTGAFSVLSERIYPDTSAYAPLERLLISRTLIVPECFSAQRQDFSRLAEQVANGAVSPDSAGMTLAAAYANNFSISASNFGP